MAGDDPGDDGQPRAVVGFIFGNVDRNLRSEAEYLDDVRAPSPLGRGWGGTGRGGVNRRAALRRAPIPSLPSPHSTPRTTWTRSATAAWATWPR